MNTSLGTNLECLRTIISQHQPKQPKSLGRSPQLSHGWLLPWLLAADDFLWQRWKHWFETASAKKVIAPIPQIQWARNDAGFKMLDRSLSAISKYGDWRGWGNWSAFDYFMDWLLYGFGHKGQWTLRFQPEIKPDTKTKTSGKPASVRLDSDHWTYVSRPIEGDYPNWKQVVPPANVLKSHITLGEPGTKIILEALPLLPCHDDKDQPVTLEIKGENLTLKAKGSGKEWTEIPIPARVSGLPVTLSMNRAYLAKALKFGFTQIDIEDKTCPMVFRAEGKMLVVCPLGVQNAAKVAAAPTIAPTPPESAPATPPTGTTAQPQEPAPQPTSEAPTEERTEMPRTARTTAPETTTHESRPDQAQTNGNGAQPAVKSLVDQVESIKDGLKGIIRDLSGLADTVKQAEKDKKATEREIEAVRTKLRQIQNVNI